MNEVERLCRECGETWTVHKAYGQSWNLCPDCRPPEPTDEPVSGEEEGNHLTEYVCDSCGGRFWFQTEELDPVKGRTECLPEYPTANDSSEPEGDERTTKRKEICECGHPKWMHSIGGRTGPRGRCAENVCVCTEYRRDPSPTDEPVSREGEDDCRAAYARAVEDAVGGYEDWRDVTGAIDEGTSLDAELEEVVKAAVQKGWHMGRRVERFSQKATHADARSGAERFAEWLWGNPGHVVALHAPTSEVVVAHADEDGEWAMRSDGASRRILIEDPWGEDSDLQRYRIVRRLSDRHEDEGERDG